MRQPDYPEASNPLSGAELLTAVQNGDTVNITPAQIAAYVGVSQWVPYTGAVIINTRYLVPTVTNPQFIPLPSLASVATGSGFEFADQDDNAGVNNITLQAAGLDQIYDHGANASSFVNRISNTTTRLIKVPYGWRAYVYGS